LLSDFNPKGHVARSFEAYLDASGITDRATVLVDASGEVRYAASVTPSGVRDMEGLVRLCEDLDRGWIGPRAGFTEPPALPAGVELFVKDRCTFSRWTIYAWTNLHLEDRIPVHNVSRDPAARERLLRLGGKDQAPALVSGGDVLYESRDIVAWLVERAAIGW